MSNCLRLSVWFPLPMKSGVKALIMPKMTYYMHDRNRQESNSPFDNKPSLRHKVTPSILGTPLIVFDARSALHELPGMQNWILSNTFYFFSESIVWSYVLLWPTLINGASGLKLDPPRSVVNPLREPLLACTHHSTILGVPIVILSYVQEGASSKEKT